MSLGSETVAPATGTAQGSTAIPSAGYRFVGWYSNAECEGEPVTTDAKVVPEKTNGAYEGGQFWAKFAENDDVTLTYVAQTGGSVDPSSETLAPATGEAKGSVATEVSTDATLTAEVVDRVAKASGAYEATTFTANFEVDFSDFGVNADGSEWTYDGSSRQIQVNGVYPGDKLTYTFGDGTVVEATVNADGQIEGAPTFKNVVDTAEVAVEVTRGTATASASASMTINQAPLTVTTPSDSKVYDGTPLTAGPATLGGLQGSDADEVTATAVGTVTEVGTVTNDATIDWGNALSSNYQLTPNYGTLTITAQSITPGEDPDNPDPSYLDVKVNYPNDYRYDGLEHTWAPTVTADDGATVLVLNQDYEVSYSTTDHTNVTGEIEVTITGIGNYSGTVKRYYQILPLQITVTADDVTKYAGEADPALTTRYRGVLEGEEPGWAGSVAREPGEAVGTYAINQGTLELANNGKFLASNYELVFVEGTLTILAAPVTPPTDGGDGGTPTPTTPGGTTPTPAPALVPGGTVTPADVNPDDATAEEAIEDEATPMAAPTETIDDDGTPLASGKHEDCWVHWLMLLGMILSTVYFVGVSVRRRKFTSNLLGYEDKVLGNDRDNA